MRVEGDVPLDMVVWLTQSPEAQHARALARALPAAEWVLTAMSRVRVRFRDAHADVEAWTGLISGRLVAAGDALAPGGPFEPYVLQLAPPLLHLESCWFAADQDGHVACFDREQLGAAPIKRCWGPRPEPALAALEPDAVLASLAGRHAPPREEAAPAYSFAVDAGALATALSEGAPPYAARRWSLALHGDRAIASAGHGTIAPEPVAASVSAWLHARGLCLGCTYAPLRDARVLGLFAYRSPGRNRAAPYERVAEPLTPWSVADAVAALGLSQKALEATVLPVRFGIKTRLQPIEYARCTWSDTVPWESEAGERHGGEVSSTG